MKLYNYWRSWASFWLRIALELKRLAYDFVPVNLARGSHHLGTYQSISRDGLVPLLEIDGLRLSQPMAVMEYLDECYPQPARLPAEAVARAQVRALAQSIAGEIHPRNNLRVLQYVVGPMEPSEEVKATWYRHWVREGLLAFERQLLAIDTARGGQVSAYCFGQSPRLADCLRVPQIFHGSV